MSSQSPESVRAGYSTLQAINPHSGVVWEVFLSQLQQAKTAKLGMGKTKELAYLVPETLMKPQAVFIGLRDEGDEGLCYVGSPSCSYRGTDGKQADPWVGQVYLVFVNKDKVVFSWRWERGVNGMPENYDKRFSKQVL